MTMISSRHPDDPADRLPLKWASKYSISHDGIVFRADGSPLKDIPLAQARRYARQDIQHDPLREAASGLTHGRGGTEELVFVEDGVRQVRLVRLMSKGERKELAHEGTTSAWVGSTVPAVGDIERGWCWLRADDGAWTLFHAPSYAAHLFRASQ